MPAPKRAEASQQRIVVIVNPAGCRQREVSFQNETVVFKTFDFIRCGGDFRIHVGPVGCEFIGTALRQPCDFRDGQYAAALQETLEIRNAATETHVVNRTLGPYGIKAAFLEWQIVHGASQRLDPLRQPLLLGPIRQNLQKVRMQIDGDNFRVEIFGKDQC